MPIISTEELQTLCTMALKNAGLRDQDIPIIIEHFLENELSGKTSHGLRRVVETIQMIEKTTLPTKDCTIEKDSGSLVTLNANGQTGVVAGHYCLQIAIQRAQQYGIAFAGIHGYISNSGSMAFYLRRICKEGLIGIIGCNSMALVAPPDGFDRLLGTNPIGIGVPGNDDDFICDVSTAAIPYGKIAVARSKGEQLPKDVIVDENGHSTTDPNALHFDRNDGAILPLAGYKGFGLGLMLELIAGPLIGSRALKNDTHLYNEDGFMMITIDPHKLSDDRFYSHITDALIKIRSSRPQAGKEKVSVPGDRSKAILDHNVKTGQIQLVDDIYVALKEMADK